MASASPERHELDDRAVTVIRQLAQDESICLLAGGQVRLVRTRRLPDHVAVGIARGGRGVVWVFLSTTYDGAAAHLRALLAQWPQGVDDEIAQAVPRVAAYELLPFDDDDEPTD